MIQIYKKTKKQGNIAASTIWAMYKFLIYDDSLIDDVINSNIDKYMDINVEPDIKSYFFFCSE